MDNLPLKPIVGTAVVCLLLQTVFQALIVGNTGSASRLLGDYLASPSPTPTPDSSPTPSPTAPVCGDISFGDKGIDKRYKSYPATPNSEFLRLWVDEVVDTETYFEVPVAALPFTIGVGAIFAKGPYAHMDATPWSEETSFKFDLTQDKSAVGVERLNLAERSDDPNYDSLKAAGTLANVVMRLPVVGNRTAQDCAVTHYLVNSSKFLAAGLHSVDDEADVDGVSGHGHIDRASIKGFATNIDFTVTYHPSSIRFCVFKLPTDPMTPRQADDRVGFFLTEFMRIGDYRREGLEEGRRPEELMDPTIRLINKMNRKSRYTGKDEIHFYVDHTVPEPFHQATKDGIMMWDHAFSKVGMKIIAHAPSDSEGFPDDYDVADIRFNTISWIIDSEDFIAIGQSVTDPRTGEILKANIVFSAHYLKSWLSDFNFYAAFPKANSAVFRAVQTPRSSTSEPKESPLLNARRLEANSDATSGGGALRGGHAKAELLRRAGVVSDASGHPAKASSPEAMFADRGWVAPQGSNSDMLDENVFADICGPGRKGHRRSSRAVHLFRKRHPHEGLICRALHDPSPYIWALVKRRGITEEKAKALLEAGIASVTVHEVGHTLGLRHNFQGSLALTLKETQIKETVNARGLTSSVMDYLPLNIISNATRTAMGIAEGNEAPYFTPKLGDYDMWAIRYGYTDSKVEPRYGHGYKKDPEIARIAELYEEPNHLMEMPFKFATDEDADSFDPYTRRHDLTKHPVEWHSEMLKLVQEAMGTLHERSIQGEESWTRIELAVQKLLGQGAFSAIGLSAYVGGLAVTRDHAEARCIGKDCLDYWNVPPGLPPLRPVSAIRTRQAVEQVVAYLNSSAAFPDRSLQREALKRVGFFGIQPCDLSKQINHVRQRVLEEVLDPKRLQHLRLAESMEHGDNEDLGEHHGFGIMKLLWALSEGILGMPPLSVKAEIIKEAEVPVLGHNISDFDLVNISTADPQRHDTQLFYLHWLALSRALHMDGIPGIFARDQRVASVLASEILRITIVLTAVQKENIRRHSRPAEADEQLGFVTNALLVMEGK